MPLSKKTGLPHTALSILLFIANNPQFNTAGDVCELRGLKRPIVSIHVEKLVSLGLLERRAVPGDRRKDSLVCTEAATGIIAEGRKLQKQFADNIFAGLGEEEIAFMEKIFKTIGENTDKIIKNDPNVVRSAVQGMGAVFGTEIERGKLENV